MKHTNYITICKVLTVALMLATPFFVAMDANRLGYIPLNGAWFVWVIPALIGFELEHE